jgi:hypothetical protein
MNKLSIETSAIETFPKSSSFKMFFGQLQSIVVIPISQIIIYIYKADLKQRSLKMFILLLFGKFGPFYPMLKGCC